MCPPKMVEALLPDRGQMFYLVDPKLDFIPEVKAFLDWKAATKRAPSTIEAYCVRLLWYYRFLDQRGLSSLEATAADLTEFVIWLCNPHRSEGNMDAIHTPSPLRSTSVNLILQAVGALYCFLVRRGVIAESPVRYIDVPKGKFLHLTHSFQEMTFLSEAYLCSELHRLLAGLRIAETPRVMTIETHTVLIPNSRYLGHTWYLGWLIIVMADE
jgi:Phage integrase, N-terminal SAM-like domain